MPADPSLVSVVMPVGSVDELLPQQLATLESQTFEGEWELVLSCNTDDAAATAELEGLANDFHACTARMVDSSDVRSASHARNVGGRAAAGALIVFCDGDDEAEPDWVSAIVAATVPGTAVGGHLGEDRLAVEGRDGWRPPATPGQLPSYLGHPYLVSANMAVYKADFEAVGGFDESLIRGEDMAISFALADHGVDLRYEPTAVIHYRHRKGLKSMLQQHYLCGRGMSQIILRGGLPDGDDGSMFRANSQSVGRWTLPHVLRKASIAAGRVVGIAEEKLRRSPR
jgi:glycosyltransferase involved in cell wall biosynthesis